MKHFAVQDIKTYNLLKPLNEMLDNGTLHWSQNQISLTNPKGHDDYTFGVGSLYLDYENSHRHVNDAGNEEIRVPRFENPLQEKDFTETCSVFQGTVFEEMLNELKSKYSIGRTRIMMLQPRYTMSWHCDTENRLHFPIKTQAGCHMIIEDEVLSLQQDTWYWTETSKYHTALNASSESRIHVVSVLVEEK